MYAVIETGGKQYRVEEGDTIFVEKLGADEQADVIFDKVVAISSDSGLNIGSPYLSGAKVTAKVIKNGKGKKIRIFKFKAKKNYRRRKGHRQPYTRVEIQKIELE
jgi:large subunit ribosomal protein L21